MIIRGRDFRLVSIKSTSDLSVLFKTDIHEIPDVAELAISITLTRLPVQGAYQFISFDHYCTFLISTILIHKRQLLRLRLKQTAMASAMYKRITDRKDSRKR
ncbi:unnamed protein product [Albugo candida]|uniref:Uncharacterized protein n=1 Tax=Albugo candida TaxID=65357 RepID=A0A024FXE4_9STRA|nr:unnamed protein product [Albugo candida]|eukprot:CCI11696.1 unnamed protein product [Albugo candida]